MQPLEQSNCALASDKRICDGLQVVPGQQPEPLGRLGSVHRHSIHQPVASAGESFLDQICVRGAQMGNRPVGQFG